MSYADVGAAIHTKIGSGTSAGTRVFNALAPTGTAYPYIVFQVIDDRPQNTNPKNDVSTLVQVASISDDPAEAWTLHNAVYDALHRSTLTVAGYSNYWMVCQRSQQLVNVIDGQQVFRYLWDVQIRLSA